MKRYVKEEVMTHQCQDTNQGWVLLDVSCQMQRKTIKSNKAVQGVTFMFCVNIITFSSTYRKTHM